MPQLEYDTVYTTPIVPKKGLKPHKLYVETVKRTSERTENDSPVISQILVVYPDGKTSRITHLNERFALRDIEMDDYDGNGTLDIRVMSAWGTGGTFFTYSTWKDGKYVDWEEPEKLGINGQVENKMITAYGRGGPGDIDLVYYSIRNGKFEVVKKVLERTVKDITPEEAGKLPPDACIITITEIWKDGKLVSREIQAI